MIRQIYVVVPDSRPQKGAFATAALLAQELEARVEALYVRPDLARRLSQFVSSEGAGIFSPDIQGMVERSEREEERVRLEFQRTMESAAVKSRPAGHGASAVWTPILDPGSEDMLLRKAIFADLIVLGLPESEEDGIPAVLDAALFSQSQPVLLAPAQPPETLLGTAFIAWNPTIQAERATMRALPFLRRAARVILCSVSTDAKPGPDIMKAAAYLRLHGVEPEIREVPPDERGVGEILLQTAYSVDAGLMVMGGYSHSRLREMILGGVTRHVLRHAKLPVLMAH